jgi:LCP family protein required for cell wall assembly
MADTDGGPLPLQGNDSEPGAAPRNRKSHRLAFIAMGLVLGTFAVAIGGIVWVGMSVVNEIGHIEDPFEALPEEERPEVVEESGTTVLLAGTDRRSDSPTTGSKAKALPWVYGAQRSDTIMLVHLTADGERGYVVSIPRDSWIDIPGKGQAKANAAFSWGGPSLFVETIEDLTDIRIDHVAVVDWAGLTALVDALGGITLEFPSDTVGGDLSWPAGTSTLSGDEVLEYVGERYRLSNGEFGRIQRQHASLRAMADAVLKQNVFTSPAATLDAARAIARSLTVDDSLGVRKILEIGLQAKNLRPSNITYVTLPNKGSAQVGDQSVVLLDTKKLDGFFTAVKEDSLEQWIERRGASVTSKTVN